MIMKLNPMPVVIISQSNWFQEATSIQFHIRTYKYKQLQTQICLRLPFVI